MTGDWQKFKGLQGPRGILRVAEPKPSKLGLFNAALAEANEGPSAEAITEKTRKSRAEKEEAAKKDAADEVKAEDAAEEAAASEEAAAE